ncbi:MAG TPA: hypothetical protein VJN89_15490 [Candidatus Acidoferrum sp.]|nr:hypothetical protein [Candidatus Acidoferrum sp.]
MPLSYRPMRPQDVGACVQAAAANPAYAIRYEPILVELERALRRGLDLLAVRAVVFEESQAAKTRTLGYGVATFLNDQFVLEIKQPPRFWIGVELAKRLARGEMPLLNDDELRLANTVGGLTVYSWLWVVLPREIERLEVRKHAMDSFAYQMDGFLLKELVGQATTALELETVIHSGGLLLGDDGRYGPAEKNCEDIYREPHVFGVQREHALSRMGTWTSLLFVHRPPQIGFRPSEQRLLIEALRGGTDEELAAELQISSSAVKKTWRLIYERVQTNGLAIVEKTSYSEPEGDRGREKKHRVLAYVRLHPEELRPISIKLLRQARHHSEERRAGRAPIRRRVRQI